MNVNRFLLISSFLLLLTIAILPPQPSIAQEKLLYPVVDERTGQFFIEKTSEHKTLNEAIFSWGIGTTYNITITAESNSSSGVIFSVTSIYFSKSWDGLSEFQVFPNESFTTSYISHCMADEPPEVSFRYSLIDSSKNASGTYHILCVDPGYQVSIPGGTGYTCVTDISAWLESKPLSNPTIGLFLMSMILLILLKRLNWLKNRKNS